MYQFFVGANTSTDFGSADNFGVYRPFATGANLQHGNILFVANHAFDCIGAKAWGFRTVFIDRRKRPFGEGPHQPDMIVKDFTELKTILS